MYDDEEDGGARRRETLARFERLAGSRVVLNPHAAVDFLEALPSTPAMKEQRAFARYYEQNDGLVNKRLVGYTLSTQKADLRACGRTWCWEDVK